MLEAGEGAALRQRLNVGADAGKIGRVACGCRRPLLQPGANRGRAQRQGFARGRDSRRLHAVDAALAARVEAPQALNLVIEELDAQRELAR